MSDVNVISEVVFGPFWHMLPGLGPNRLGQSISLKFSLKTKLESKSFELLIDFLGVSGSKVMI